MLWDAHCFGTLCSESPGWETNSKRVMSSFLTQEKDCEPTFFRRQIVVKSNRAGRRRGILETSVDRGENGELRGPRWDIFTGTDSHCQGRRPAVAPSAKPSCTAAPPASRPRWLRRALGDGCGHQNMPGMRGSEAPCKWDKGTKDHLAFQVQIRHCFRSGPLLNPGVQLFIGFWISY